MAVVQRGKAPPAAAAAPVSGKDRILLAAAFLEMQLFQLGRQALSVLASSFFFTVAKPNLKSEKE